MIEKFKNIFQGLDRAHGVTIVGESNGNGTKVKGKSFAESVGKGEIQAKPETQEQTKKSLNL